MEEALLEAPLEEALASAPGLLRAPSTAVATTVALLRRLQLDDSPAAVGPITRLLAAWGTPCASATAALLEALPCVESATAKELLLAVGCLVVSRPSAELDAVVDVYRELVSADRTLLLPVIGSLSELPLAPSTRDEVSEMALRALSVVDESDVPALARALLAVVPAARAAATAAAVRACARGLSAGTLALAAEVVAGALRLNAPASVAYLRALGREAPSLHGPLDLLLLLAMLPHATHGVAAASALRRLAAADGGVAGLRLVRRCLAEPVLAERAADALPAAVRELLRARPHAAGGGGGGSDGGAAPAILGGMRCALAVVAAGAEPGAPLALGVRRVELLGLALVALGGHARELGGARAALAAGAADGAARTRAAERAAVALAAELAVLCAEHAGPLAAHAQLLAEAWEANAVALPRGARASLASALCALCEHAPRLRPLLLSAYVHKPLLAAARRARADASGVRTAPCARTARQGARVGGAACAALELGAAVVGAARGGGGGRGGQGGDCGESENGGVGGSAAVAMVAEARAEAEVTHSLTH
ncbi:hypothetical protein T492DRAFT_916763 [Pavlovales sp. CCMP2436]|nr:hypothetical protein T492DRAFT_916763 [Pavlovales sp. CCMP2436]